MLLLRLLFGFFAQRPSIRPLFSLSVIFDVCVLSPKPKTYLVESEMQSSSRNFYVNWHIKAPLAYNQAYLFHF